MGECGLDGVSSVPWREHKSRLGPSKGPVIRPRIHGPSSPRCGSPIAGGMIDPLRPDSGAPDGWTAARAQDCRGRGRIPALDGGELLRSQHPLDDSALRLRLRR